MAQSVWKLCVASLQDELPSQQFNTWIRPLQIDESTAANELRLLAPNRFICDWVSEKFLVRINELVSQYQQGQLLQVAVGVAPRSMQAAVNPSFAQQPPEPRNFNSTPVAANSALRSSILDHNQQPFHSSV